MNKSYYFVFIFLSVFCVKTIGQNSLSPTADGFFIPGLIPGSTPVATYNLNYLPLSNYHFFNPYYFNPAMAGIEEKKQLNADWIRQADHSFLLSYEQPISSINSAIGMQYSYTSDFFSSVRYIGFAYNYGFNLKDKAKLKFGFQFSQASISINEFLFGVNDKKGQWYNSPTLDLGLAFKTKNVKIGFSVQNLFPTSINSADSISNFYNIINGYRQFNTSFAYSADVLKNCRWSLAGLIRSNNANDFSSYLTFSEKYFIGTTFRVDDEDDIWITFVGLKIKEKMNLQFSFNATKDDRKERRFFETLIQSQFYFETLVQYQF